MTASDNCFRYWRHLIWDHKLFKCAIAVVLALMVLPSTAQDQVPKRPCAAMGVMVGEPSSSSVHVQVRLTESEAPVDGDLVGLEGSVEFRLYKVGSELVVDHQILKASEHRDYIARATFKSLDTETEYRCETELSTSSDVSVPGPQATFKTLPSADSPANIRFVVVTGMNYAKFHGDERIDRKRHTFLNNTDLPEPYAGEDKDLGYPALATILCREPDFFIGTGDNVYYDTPNKPRAKSVPELRQKWHEQFAQPRFRELFAKVPSYWMIDDHDFRVDDCDNSGEYDPLPIIGRRMMLEQLPVARADDANAKTYRTHRVGKHLQLWFPENRMYRSDNAMEDGPEKSIWGIEQTEWLMKSLEASDATFKLLVSPTPMVGPDDRRKTDNHCDIGGFMHERDQFFSWLREEGIAERNFFIVCGDRHWQYHAIDPSGIEEFSCGALVDANSRLGRKAGDPECTDPKGLIKQPYLQAPASGGFLEINVMTATDIEPATLEFTWFDENGKELHAARKP